MAAVPTPSLVTDLKYEYIYKGIDLNKAHQITVPVQDKPDVSKGYTTTTSAWAFCDGSSILYGLNYLHGAFSKPIPCRIEWIGGTDKVVAFKVPEGEVLFEGPGVALDTEIKGKIAPIQQMAALHLSATLRALVQKKWDDAMHVFKPIHKENEMSNKTKLQAVPGEGMAFKGGTLPTGTQFFIDKNIQHKTVMLQGWAPSGQYGMIDVIQPVTLMQVEKGDVVEEPAMSMAYEAAQNLMQALWDAGFRPYDEDKSKIGEVVPKAAFDQQAKHLEDMRNIAFAFINQTVELKK